MGNTREVRDLEFGDTEPLGVFTEYILQIHFTDTTSIGYATER